MDAVKQQIQRLQQQLSGLDASQKMLTGTLVAIMVISVAWFATRAGTPEFQPVLDQSVTPDEVGPMRAALQGAGIDFRVEGDRVMVPADRQLEALSVLGFNSAMPRNAGQAFDRMLEKTSAWDPAFKTKELILQAKQQMLAEILSMSADVRDAHVMLDMHQERRIGKAKKPSASISLFTYGDNASKDLIQGAVDTVCGSVSGLEPANVRITVNGLARRVKDDASHMGQATELFEQQAQLERYYADKIYDSFSFMPQIVANVTVDVNATSRSTDSLKVDAENMAVLPKSSTSSLTERNSGGPGGEPGAVPNTGASMWDSHFGGAETETAEQTTELTDALVGQSSTREITPAGTHSVVAAAVHVPLSYVRQEFLADNPDASEPTRDELAATEARILADVRETVARVTAIGNETLVSVKTYTDNSTPLLAAAGNDVAGVGVGGGTLGMMMSDYGKEAMLGLLAVVGLFAVLRMVKQSTPDAVTDIPNIQEALSTLRGEMAVGEAGEGTMLLDATEADPDQIEAKQMVEQVQELVADNPDAAAQLMRRWLNH